MTATVQTWHFLIPPLSLSVERTAKPAHKRHNSCYLHWDIANTTYFQCASKFPMSDRKHFAINIAITYYHYLCNNKLMLTTIKMIFCV